MFLNNPENVIEKVQVYRKNVYTEPLIQTQTESNNKQILVDVNWLNKAIWELNKTLKGVSVTVTGFDPGTT